MCRPHKYILFDEFYYYCYYNFINDHTNKSILISTNQGKKTIKLDYIVYLFK